MWYNLKCSKVRCGCKIHKKNIVLKCFITRQRLYQKLRHKDIAYSKQLFKYLSSKHITNSIDVEKTYLVFILVHRNTHHLIGLIEKIARNAAFI